MNNIKIKISGQVDLDLDLTLDKLGKLISFISMISKPDEILSITEQTEVIPPIESSQPLSGEVSGGKQKKISSLKKHINREIDDNVKGIIINRDVPAFSKYHTLTTNTDKILYILKVAYDNGVSALSTSEISFMTEKFAQKVLAKNLHSGLKTLRGKSFIIYEASINKYKIQHKGVDYIDKLNFDIQS